MDRRLSAKYKGLWAKSWQAVSVACGGDRGGRNGKRERERESLFGDVKVFLAVTVAAAATAGSGQEACF